MAGDNYCKYLNYLSFTTQYLKRCHIFLWTLQYIIHMSLCSNRITAHTNTTY